MKMPKTTEDNHNRSIKFEFYSVACAAVPNKLKFLTKFYIYVFFNLCR